MKNHEVVPLALVAAIANLHRGSVNRALVELMKHDLVAHDRGKQCKCTGDCSIIERQGWCPIALIVQ